ncbi:MAG TPA: M12 family metallo-peptidase [Rudaea sp.]|nr:M12 family metallo-peptidase [Rudaea sp.]
MKRLRWTLFVIAWTLFFLAQATPAAERTLDRSTILQLGALPVSQSLAVDTFPIGPTRSTTIRFQRVSIYASNARIYAETPSGRIELPRSDLIFLRGYSDDGRARVALTLSPQSSVLRGSGDGPEGSFTLHATQMGASTRLVAVKLESDLPPGFNFEFRCGNETEHLVNLSSSGQESLAAQIASATQATTAGHTLRFAVVAVDTDSLFMSRLFSNNTVNATNYIATMFNTMNLMYERDLQVQLLIGTTILRTSAASDPYTSFTEGASTDQLDTFANYWKTNEGGVTRAFAILLSGVIPSSPGGCSASGIAWLKQYCNKGTTQGSDTVGSYSVNQVCTNLSIDQSDQLNARLVGHEIGHNFGAWHTHCTDVSTGNAPVGTNTIDTCFTGESYVISNVTKPCFSGTPTCPAAGAGTIMSYCNQEGCPANTQNLLQFHPTHITDVIDPAILAAPANCLNTTDDIFFSPFE